MLDKKVGAKCIGCGACESVCSIKCIQLKNDNEGFLYPIIETSKCLNCGKCEKICPILSNIENHSIFDSTIIGAKAKKEYEGEIKNSASAGVFYFLAQYFIRQNGYIFGAVFDKDFTVKHVCARTIDEVKRMQNSKYVQSDIRGIYGNIKLILSMDPTAFILFCGTPCQCYGLRSYLQEDYEHLLIVDMVCHGVPSPLAFKKYLGNLIALKREPLEDFQFRYKLKGWNYKGYMSSYVKYNNHYWAVVKDPYMSAFLNQSDYRECCYECNYNTTKKSSDLTLEG